MKKNFRSEAILLIIMSLIPLTTMNSCSDDSDDDLDGLNKDLIGTWVLIHDEGYEMYEGEKDEYNNSYEVSEKSWVREFHEDGSFVGYDEEIKDEGTWKMQGDSLFISIGGLQVDKERVLSLNASKLVTESREEDSWYDKSTFQKIE